MLEPLAAGDPGDRLDLRAGVELAEHIGADPVDPLLFQPGGAGRGHVDGDLERAHVGGGADLLGELPDAVHHGRHQIEVGRAVLGDRVEHLFGHEAREVHDVVAANEGQRGDRERGVVIEHAGDHTARGRRQEEPRGVGVEATRHRGQDDLRSAGATARGGGLPELGDDIGQFRVVDRQVGFEPDRHATTARQASLVDADHES